MQSLHLLFVPQQKETHHYEWVFWWLNCFVVFYFVALFQLLISCSFELRMIGFLQNVNRQVNKRQYYGMFLQGRTKSPKNIVGIAGDHRNLKLIPSEFIFACLLSTYSSFWVQFSVKKQNSSV